MSHPTALTFRLPVFRHLAFVIGLLGFVNASLFPYQSLIGIERIGLTEAHFALILVLASAIAVTTSVYVGILSDQRASRRRIALITAIIGLIGSGLMVVAPGPWTFLLAHGVLLPIGSTLFGQTFALTRLATQTHPEAREGVQATIRASMSVTFLAMLVFWTFAFGTGLSVMWVYVSGFMASAVLAVLIWRGWPVDGSGAWVDRPSGLRLGAALAQLARPAVSTRLIALGALSSCGTLYMILLSLVFDATPGRGTADTALYMGLVAGWEVPFMLLLPPLVAHLPRARLLVFGTALYATHLVLIPLLAGSAWIWVLTLAAGLGGTAILIIPISYYQDLMADQPGMAGAMLALQKLVGDMMAALAFTIGAVFGGYALTAAIGGGIAMAGALALWLIDRPRRQRGEPLTPSS